MWNIPHQDTEALADNDKTFFIPRALNFPLLAFRHDSSPRIPSSRKLFNEVIDLTKLFLSLQLFADIISKRLEDN